jgi:glycosyltransferase involved in cell wall biosynthesis
MKISRQLYRLAHLVGRAFKCRLVSFAKTISRSTWITRRTLLRHVHIGLSKVSNSSIPGRAPTAALIFAGTFWDPAHQFHRCGSGRMQQEAFACLQALGLKTTFSDAYVPCFPREVVRADIVVSIIPGATRLPARCRGQLLVYTANTHVLERTPRLQAAARFWGLPLESESFRGVEEHLLAYKRADYLLIAENDQGIGNFLKHGIPPQKIKRYNNCVDTDVWTASTIKRDKFSFICYGSALGLRKGLPVLLAAWQLWYRGQDAELHIVGIPSVVSDHLLSGARRGEVRPGLHVQLEGFPAQHPSIIRLIGSCHVAIFPTLEDAQPSSLLEMSSCGLPVITTAESGVEFSSDFCRYVEADSVEDLSDALDYWYSRRNSVAEDGQRAREFIIANHCWPHFRRRFSAILREVMATAGIKPTSSHTTQGFS